jgi:TatD DNase family protein
LLSLGLGCSFVPTKITNNAPSLVDAHCHIDRFEEPEAVAAEVERHQVHTISVTSLPSSFTRMEVMLEGLRHLVPAVGFHPLQVTRFPFQLSRMLQLLERVRLVGEIGLDYSSPGREDHKLQRHVLEKVLLRCAELGDKVLSVHSRRAASDVIDAIGPGFPGRVILHWFSGSEAELDRAMALGMYLSINPSMARSKGGARLIRAAPVERILTESDGPYVRLGRRPARPTDVAEALARIADLLGSNRLELARRVSATFEEIMQPAPEAG